MFAMLSAIAFIHTRCVVSAEDAVSKTGNIELIATPPHGPVPSEVLPHGVVQHPELVVHRLRCELVTLHSDVAGVVAEVAPDVKGFKKGDHVYGCAGGVLGLGGALAEYMLADAALIARKPESLAFEEAAALPLVTLTAWEALRERAVVKTGGASHACPDRRRRRRDRLTGI